MSAIPNETLRSVHRDCFQNRSNVQRSKVLGCFYCLKTFPPADIKKWIDKESTALCPHCGIDAVLPDTIDVLKDASWLELLEAMYSYWFSPATPI